MFKKINVLKLHYRKLGLLNLLSYILNRMFKSQNKIIKVYINGYSHPIFLRNNPADTQIFTQIFLRDDLDVCISKYPKVIIDAGANIGCATLYLKHKYPHATIYSVEPDTLNFNILKRNTEHFDDVFCYNKALWNRNAQLKIINPAAGSESFIVEEINSEENTSDGISAVTINQIVKENSIEHIDLLKLDIEGSEKIIFKDNYHDWLSITDNMLIEIHNWINKDAEMVVMEAVSTDFAIEMAGEYHFFERK